MDGGTGFALWFGPLDHLRIAAPEADFWITVPGEVRKANTDRPCSPDPVCPLSSSSCDDKMSPPDCSDHDVALRFTIIAQALQAVHLGQVVDEPAVVSVHGREEVALLAILSLYRGKRG